MKFIIKCALLLISLNLSAQISIEKTTSENLSAILDFNNVSGNTKGVILPAVDNVNSALAASPSANNGTFLFDKSDKKIKMFENNSWKSLSNVGDTSGLLINTTSEQTTDQGVILGSQSSSAKGVLILESSDKAMILPKIENPHLNVQNPYPGMMCYDTYSKSLAVFDGLKWSYWK